MSTVITAPDLGPKKVIDAGSGVIVVLSGPSIEVDLFYADLDTLTETLILFQEAHAELTAAIIRLHGRPSPAGTIAVGDRIVGNDDEIVEVTAVAVHTDRVGLVYEDGYLEREKNEPVMRIVPTLAAVR